MSAVLGLLEDAFGRVHESVHQTVEGLDAEQLAYRPPGPAGARGNSIGWLVWHLTRVQDDHLADVAETEQVWTARGWADRFGLSLPPDSTGYAHSSADVDAVRADAELLLGYHDAVYQQTIGYVRTVREGDLARIVDTRWDPPVTLAVRLVSVISDDLQHIGQAAYLRGLLP
jgi:hypothetical protein